MNLFFPIEVETKDNPETLEFRPETRHTDWLDLELTPNLCSALPGVRTPAKDLVRRRQRQPWQQLQLLGLTRMKNLAPSNCLAGDYLKPSSSTSRLTFVKKRTLEGGHCPLTSRQDRGWRLRLLQKTAGPQPKMRLKVKGRML
jgi:hypothetical protein